MKNNTQPYFYFSAYPLKVIGTTAETNLRVSRPKNPDGILKTLPADLLQKKSPHILPDNKNIQDMENHDVSWYNNYE